MKEFHAYSVDVECLADILSKQGYTVVEYSQYSNDPSVEKLLSSLRLEEYSKSVKAFTYVDSVNRIVFIVEGLSNREKLILLAHEEGHIYNDHMDAGKDLAGQDIIHEQEANDFAHYILYPSTLRSIYLFGKFNKILIILIFLSFIVGMSFVGGALYKKSMQKMYVVTQNGKKYHTSDCRFVKGKDNLRYFTLDDLIDMGYEPCSECIGKQ
ncbi:MAG: hypothetical protein Q8882_02130 [Bacillota bacterium]|nr:hypothetical protein [Bacillota bacterium]